MTTGCRQLMPQGSPCRHEAYDWRTHVPRNADVRLGGLMLIAAGIATAITTVF